VEEETLVKCKKLMEAYRRLVTSSPNVSTDYVMQKVQEASQVYIDTLHGEEFAKEMIGRVVYRIIELEAERNRKEKNND